MYVSTTHVHVLAPTLGVQYIEDEVPKYLTRPHHMQPAHTGKCMRYEPLMQDLEIYSS